MPPSANHDRVSRAFQLERSAHHFYWRQADRTCVLWKFQNRQHPFAGFHQVRKAGRLLHVRRHFALSLADGRASLDENCHQCLMPPRVTLLCHVPTCSECECRTDLSQRSDQRIESPAARSSRTTAAISDVESQLVGVVVAAETEGIRGFIGDVGLASGHRERSLYFSRTDCGTGGTAHILPPLSTGFPGSFPYPSSRIHLWI
jgi:hypothetical protein